VLQLLPMTMSILLRHSLCQPTKLNFVKKILILNFRELNKILINFSCIEG